MTHSDETKDKIAQSMLGKNKGDSNGMYGRPNPKAKLTLDDANAIRAEYALGQLSTRQLATAFGVTKGVITKILNNETYKNYEPAQTIESGV